jgi:hypothetical protein
MTEHGKMSKGEREDLAKLVRRREKLAKADVDRVGAERLAEFEGEVASVYHIDDDAVWREAHAAASKATAEAKAKIAERCRELGIQERFAPTVEIAWYSRGENASRDRVTELRRVAKTRFDAEGKAAKAEIERQSVEVQTELVAGGLESDEARAFLASMPEAEALMPPVPTVAEIEEAS